MNFQTVLLVVAALAPAIVMGAYVFKKDRIEKEPVSLLIALIVSGVVICLPVIVASTALEEVFYAIFSPMGEIDIDGNVVLPDRIFKIYNFLYYLIAIAFVEEGFKWLALLFITRKNKNFNSLFDGIVYAVFVSLGFAAAENILYVLENGWPTAVMRAVTAVPAHVFNAVIMGYFYSIWKVYSIADKYETALQLNNPGTSEHLSSKRYLFMSIAMPTLTHGLYDHCCTLGGIYNYIFYAYLIGLYIYCFGKIRKMSKMDISISVLSKAIFLKCHPGAENQIAVRTELPGEGAPQTDESVVRTYTMPGGDTYYGKLSGGKLSGYGIYTFASGGKYEGFFAEGKMNGYGVFTYANGDFYRGFWKDNQKHGEGSYYTAKTATVTKGVWENGVMTSDSGNTL